MLKIQSSFSKKVPVPGVEMSSQSYHATIEAELPGGLTSKQIQDKMHETFEMVRTSVEAELESSETDNGKAPKQLSANNTGNGKDNGNPASKKQLKYIRNLSTHHGYNRDELDGIVSKQFGVENVNQLTSKQASTLIDQFNIPQKNGRKAA